MLERPDPSSGKYHIAICIPSHDTVPYQFANSLANMIGHSIHMIGDMVDITTQWVIGTYIHRARQQLIDQVYAEGAHYILWLDSDHDFPKESLIRLLQHDKPIVGVNYASRGTPPRYVGIKKTHAEHGSEACLLPTREDSTGLEECEALGFGMLLMKTAILPTLPKDEPWFFFGHGQEDEHGQRNHIGEDVWFCKLVRDAGWEILCDHDLSKEIHHVGQIAYRLNHVWAMEEAGYDVDYDVRGTTDGTGELDKSERHGSDDQDGHPVGGEEDGEGQASEGDRDA